MRFVVHPVGSGGDVLPLVGIGAELRRRGHGVTVLSGEPFRGLVTSSGLDFRSLFSDDEYSELVAQPHLWTTTGGPRIVLGASVHDLRRTYDAIAEACRGEPTVLVGHSLSLAMRVFAEKHDAPMATVHLSPSVFRSDFVQPVVAGGVDLTRAPRWVKRAFWGYVDRVVDGIAAPPVNALRTELGLAPVSRLFREWWHAPRLVLGMFPEWFGMQQPDWPGQLRLAGFPRFDGGDATLEPTVERFLDDGEPPVVFTPGTANVRAAPFFRAAAEAVGRLGRRALFLTGHAAQVPAPLPPAIRHVPFAPLGALLPRCAAIVHHGGIGTCSRGLQAGVPQLTMPMAFDQPDNAARIARLGVGRSLAPKRFTGARVAAALSELLDSDAIADACLRWKPKASRDGAVRAAEILESFGNETKG